jgi:hypothetical protein
MFAVVLIAIDLPAQHVLLMVSLPPLLRRQAAAGLAIVPNLLIEPRFLMLELRGLLGRE